MLQIALAQNLLFWAILLAIVFGLGSIALNALFKDIELNPTTFYVINATQLLVRLAVIIWQIYAVVRMCQPLGNGKTATIVYSALQIIPCISLIALLVLNSKATQTLKWAGMNYEPKDRICPHCGEPVESDDATCPMCGAAMIPI
jgi:hypothetical protein